MKILLEEKTETDNRGGLQKKQPVNYYMKNILFGRFLTWK